ncbi:hypothetical protein LguiB_018794 [Lonicera macranthoides]
MSKSKGFGLFFNFFILFYTKLRMELSNIQSWREGKELWFLWIEPWKLPP